MEAQLYPNEPDLSTFPPSLPGKRILLCTESFGPVNGVSRTTLMLVNHLRANGVLVAVVAPENHTNHNTFIPLPSTITKPSPETTPSYHYNTELRLQGYPLPTDPSLSLAYPVRLSTLLTHTFGGGSDLNQPHLIYLASPASLGFQVLLQNRQLPADQQIPVICNFQTDLSGYCKILFPGGLGEFAGWVLGGVQGWLFRHGSVRTVFYPSKWVGRYLAWCGVDDGTGKGKLEVLGRGVDTGLFCPGKRRNGGEGGREEGDRGIVLICVARLAEEKGFGFLSEVVRRLGERGLGFTLYVVGGNTNKVVEEGIKGLFGGFVDSDLDKGDGDRKAKGKVIFTGYLMGEELATAYASADIFLHCSVTETFGLVVLESMASGVPVIARDEGGPSDIVRHGESGYLVPPDDMDTFVERVMTLAEDAELRARLSRGARKQAEEMSWERINNKVAWRMARVNEEWESERDQRGEEQSWDIDVDFERGQRPMVGRNTDVITRYEAVPTIQSARIMVHDALLARLVDVRLAGSMAAISASWVAVGGYIAFIQLKLWVQKQFWRGGG